MTNDSSQDARDVSQAMAGDREAYSRLYDRYVRGVRAIVAAVSRDFQLVEDLTQETFLRGYLQLATLNDASRFGVWIGGIARIVAQESLRKKKTARSLVEAGDEPGMQAIDMAEHEEEQRRLMSAVAELPENERLAIHAYYFFEAHNAAQAATAVGMSRSGFYAALERGLARLRKRLTNHPSFTGKGRRKK